ncbi:hypothetical protein N656DRAFT_290981 [Canariomyces notabilis]|uniref:Uncharacterized protein n=1 Tax=Canariomyces notabilis TaxID=2074819 RepID=A0AAN6T9P5_9PEZI|nr:hypothetical protein N656DRAFT_290981 [Canariomyces arenarius]
MEEWKVLRKVRSVRKSSEFLIRAPCRHLPTGALAASRSVSVSTAHAECLGISRERIVVLGAARLAVRASPSGLRVLKPLMAAETWRIPQHLEGLAGIFRFVSIVSFKSNSYWIAVRWPAGMLGLIDLGNQSSGMLLNSRDSSQQQEKKTSCSFFLRVQPAAWLRPWVAYRRTEVAPLSPEARIALPVTGNRYRIDYRERRDRKTRHPGITYARTAGCAAS